MSNTKECVHCGPVTYKKLTQPFMTTRGCHKNVGELPHLYRITHLVIDDKGIIVAGFGQQTSLSHDQQTVTLVLQPKEISRAKNLVNEFNY